MATRTAILSLLFFRSPAYVAGFVVAVFIGPAVESVFWRRFAAHIIQENRVIIPDLAKGYACSAIEVIGMVVGVVTTAARLFPRDIFWGLPLVSRLAVRCLAFSEPVGGGLAVPAAAGLGMSANQMPGRDQRLLSAIAPTEPNHTTITANMANFYGGKAGKTLTSEVFSYRHREPR